MAKQQVYTSVPEGVWPNSNGYCTVLCTEGIPRTVADMLEAFSVYRIVDKGPDGTISPTQENYSDLVALNPPSLCHISFKFRRDQIHVMMKTCLAGFDYSGRLRKMTHFLVLDESDKKPAGPAWMLRQPGVTLGDWGGKPTMLTEDKVLPDGESPARPCKTWEAATGDAGWAGVLADTVAGSYRRIAYIIYTQEMDAAELLEEALALLPPEKRWEATFSTNFTRLPQNIECQWRFTLADSPEVALAMRRNDLLVLDLTSNLGTPATSDAVEAAREGRQLKVATVQRGSAITGIRRMPDAEEMTNQVAEVNFSEIDTEFSDAIVPSSPQTSHAEEMGARSDFESPPALASTAAQTSVAPPVPPPSPATRAPSKAPIPIPPPEPPASSSRTSFAAYYIGGGVASLLFLVSVVVIAMLVIKNLNTDPPVLTAPQGIVLAPANDGVFSVAIKKSGLITVDDPEGAFRICLPNGEAIPNPPSIKIPLYNQQQQTASANPAYGILEISPTGDGQFSIDPNVFRKLESDVRGKFEYAVFHTAYPKVVSNPQALEIVISAAPKVQVVQIPAKDAIPPLTQPTIRGESMIWQINEEKLGTYFPAKISDRTNTSIEPESDKGGVGMLKKVDGGWAFSAMRSEIEKAASETNEFHRVIQFFAVDKSLNNQPVEQMGVALSIRAPEFKENNANTIKIDHDRAKRAIPFQIIRDAIGKALKEDNSNFDLWFGNELIHLERGANFTSVDGKATFLIRPAGPEKVLSLTLQTPPANLPAQDHVLIQGLIGLTKNAFSQKFQIQIPLPVRSKPVVDGSKPDPQDEIPPPKNPPAEVPLVEQLIAEISPGNTWRRDDTALKFHLLDIGKLEKPIVWATFDPKKTEGLELSFETMRVEKGVLDNYQLVVAPSDGSSDSWKLSSVPADSKVGEIVFSRETGQLTFEPGTFASPQDTSTVINFLRVHTLRVSLKIEDLAGMRVFQFHQPTPTVAEDITLPEFKTQQEFRIVSFESPWTRAEIESLSPVMAPEIISPKNYTAPEGTRSPQLRLAKNLGYVSLEYAKWNSDTAREEEGFQSCSFNDLKNRCTKLQQLELEENGDKALLDRYETFISKDNPIKFAPNVWILSSADPKRQILLAAPAGDRVSE